MSLNAEPKYEAFVIDYETLGQDPDQSPVLSVSVTPFTFDHTKKKSIKEIVDNEPQFFAKFKIDDQVKNHGRIIDKGTVDWWGSQSEDAKKKSLYPKDTDVNVSDAHLQLDEFVRKHCVPKPIMFCRGQSFDFPFFAFIIRDYKLGNLKWFKFWNQRDSRSYIAGALTDPYQTNCPLPKGTLDEFVYHDPIWDNAKEIMQLQYVTWYARGDEEVPDEFDIVKR